MTDNLPVPGGGAVPAPLSILDIPVDEQAVQRHDQFLSFAKKKLQLDADYGPPYANSKKNVLLKSGAEKLTASFRLRPQYEITPSSIRDHEKGFFYFEVKTVLYYGDTPVGEGLGSANSREVKYKYRWMTEKEIKQDETLDDIRLEDCPKRTSQYNPTKYRVPNPEIHDAANTILKIAKKRSLVDACLSTFGLSSAFTQDVEDLPDYREPSKPSTKSRKPVKQQAAPPQKQERATKPETILGPEALSRVLEMAHKRLAAMGCSEQGLEYVDRQLLSRLGVPKLEEIPPTDIEAVREFFQAEETIKDLRTESYMPLER